MCFSEEGRRVLMVSISHWWLNFLWVLLQLHRSENLLHLSNSTNTYQQDVPYDKVTKTDKYCVLTLLYRCCIFLLQVENIEFYGFACSHHELNSIIIPGCASEAADVFVVKISEPEVSPQLL